MLRRGRGGRGKDCTPLGRWWRGQRLYFLREVVAGTKPARPWGGVGGFLDDHNCLTLLLGDCFFQKFRVTYQLIVILLLSKKTRNLRLNIWNFFICSVINSINWKQLHLFKRSYCSTIMC